MDRLKQWVVNLDAADKGKPRALAGQQARVSAIVFSSRRCPSICGLQMQGRRTRAVVQDQHRDVSLHLAATICRLS
jgi:hypothetical protein